MGHRYAWVIGDHMHCYCLNGFGICLDPTHLKCNDIKDFSRFRKAEVINVLMCLKARRSEQNREETIWLHAWVTKGAGRTIIVKNLQLFFAMTKDSNILWAWLQFYIFIKHVFHCSQYLAQRGSRDFTKIHVGSTSNLLFLSFMKRSCV